MYKGLRLEGKKEATLLAWTVRKLTPPKRVRIPLVMTADGFAVACVEPGTQVRMGELIARPANAQSVAIHASLSGIVTRVGTFSHPVFGETQAVEIEGDGKDEKNPPVWNEKKDWEKTSREEVLTSFQERGLVEMEGAMKPLHIKAGRRVKRLVLNACEPESYQTCDHALMMSHPLEVLKGADLLRWVMESEEVLILTQDDKLEIAETLRSKIYFLKWEHIRVETQASVFPWGKESMIRRRMSQEMDPQEFEIFNVATAYAAYEAIVFQKPLIERVVTLTGECMIEPKNVWARIGIDFEALIKSGAKGFLRQPGKVLMGGPMTGFAQEHLESPIIPCSQALTALPEEVTQVSDAQPCIRCGECVEVCPVDIHPAMITLAAEKGLFDLARNYGVQKCVECGNCSYVCPSKRPMGDLIRLSMESQHVLNRNKRHRKWWAKG